MPDKIFLHDIDLARNTLKRAKLYPLSTANRLALPLLPQDEGLVSYDLDLDTIFLWNGVVWIELSVGAGAGDKTYTHVQGSSSATWTVTHNLAKFPSVTVVDSGGTEVEGEVTHIDNNSLTISFTAPFSGTAYMN